MAYVFNTTQLGVCNDRIDGLNKWVELQMELYKNATGK